MSNLMPGYMTLPNDAETGFGQYMQTRQYKPLHPGQTSYWQNYRKFFVSFQKAIYGCTPVCGVVTDTGQVPGTRYLHCSLCGTSWDHVRAVCIMCGQSRAVTLRAIEEDSGAAKVETCDDCGTYAKMLYQTQDVGVDPFADDLATLGLDVLAAEEGWSRHAPNPFLLPT